MSQCCWQAESVAVALPSSEWLFGQWRMLVTLSTRLSRRFTVLQLCYAEPNVSTRPEGSKRDGGGEGERGWGGGGVVIIGPYLHISVQRATRRARRGTAAGGGGGF